MVRAQEADTKAVKDLSPDRLFGRFSRFRHGREFRSTRAKDQGSQRQPSFARRFRYEARTPLTFVSHSLEAFDRNVYITWHDARTMHKTLWPKLLKQGKATGEMPHATYYGGAPVGPSRA